jgi:predicted extracellular nuclease
VQTTSGVITKKLSGGFFIQDPTGDGDPTTSDAIYVFGATTSAKVGDLVRVTGTVTEYTPSGAPVPTPNSRTSRRSIPSAAATPSRRPTSCSAAKT